MTGQPIRYTDGDAYERAMGRWSRLAGEVVLDWLAPRPGLRWIDIGCGNGAFTELLIARTSPSEVQGIDPSEAQLAFARSRPAACLAEFRKGDAMKLPFPDESFDAAVMALVIFFVPEPAKGVAEMARVVRPGGLVTSYVWDMRGGGFPIEAIRDELRAMGIMLPIPPSSDATRMAVLEGLWIGAGLEAVETREVVVQRTFADFDDYWATNLLGTTIRPTVAAMTPDQVERLKTRVRARFVPDAAGRVTCSARANAIKGRVRP
jgi:SAM-dependent methyltransferase